VKPPNLVEIDETAAEMAIFQFFFQDGGRRRVGFLKFEIFNGRSAQEGRTASPCQIMVEISQSAAEIW